MKHPRQFKKKRWSLKRIFLPLILAGIVGLNLYSLQAERIAGNPMPMPFEYGAAVVLSDSMAPVLSSGDVVIVRQTDTFNIGDIVVYQSGRSLVVHRVIAIEQRERTLQDNLRAMHDVDLILIEGYKNEQIPKIGISRKAAGKGLPGLPCEYIAVVTDEKITLADIPVFSLDDINGILNFVLKYFHLFPRKQ